MQTQPTATPTIRTCIFYIILRKCEFTSETLPHNTFTRRPAHLCLVPVLPGNQ